MKQLKLIITSSLTIALLSACGTSTGVAPSQNSALNSISDSNGKEKSGYMQQGLDSWLKDDWTPTVEQNEEVRSKYMKKAESNSSKQTDAAVTEQGLDGNSSKELSKNSEVQYVEKSDRNFTLQEYVDKAGAYMEDKEPTSGTSNVKKLESMPVIGK